MSDVSEIIERYKHDPARVYLIKSSNCKLNIMKSIIICIIILFAAASCFAHGGKKHKKDSVKIADSLAKVAQVDTVKSHDEHHEHGTKALTADFADFPTLHPLIVHFAIVLIVIAAALQLLNLALVKKELAWITAGILLIGFLAVWFASGKFHPHTHGISEHAQKVLNEHDKWADWTKYSAFIALILQAVNLFLFQSKRWAMAVVAVVLTLSAFSVSIAGHYGAQLVHIEGIGPQGKFLEDHHH